MRANEFECTTNFYDFGLLSPTTIFHTYVLCTITYVLYLTTYNQCTITLFFIFIFFFAIQNMFFVLGKLRSSVWVLKKYIPKMEPQMWSVMSCH